MYYYYYYYHYYRLLNNNPLSGKIPELKNISYWQCNFQNTDLCYDEREKNSKCSYPKNNCSKCVINANLNNNVC